MTDSPHSDRRRHQRAYVPAVASLLLDENCVGKCLVRNLSVSGALLLGAPVLPPGTPCHIVLQGPGVGVLRLFGMTVRARATEGESGLAIEFRDVCSEVCEQLRRLVESAMDERFSPAVLVVDGEVSTLIELAEGLGRLGHRTLLALTPLEAVRWLCDLSTSVESVLVSSSGLSGSGTDLLAFIGEEFPCIHRVLVHDELPAGEMLAVIGESNARAHLSRPFSLEALATALESAPATRQPPWRRAG
jgi:hypothetical protein